MTDDPRDDDLERAFREGLRQAADRTEVGVPLVDRAHAGARSRRRRRWAVVGTVAAVVAVSGTAFAVRSGSAPDPDRRPTDHAVTEPTTEAAVTGWRAESWHDLTVDVPADWGWGTAPIEMSFDKGHPVLCGLGAVVRPDGTQRVNPKADNPWVGRPVMLSDACLGEPFPTPEASYVWLGADIEPGHRRPRRWLHPGDGRGVRHHPDRRHATIPDCVRQIIGSGTAHQEDRAGRRTTTTVRRARSAPTAGWGRTPTSSSSMPPPFPTRTSRRSCARSTALRRRPRSCDATPEYVVVTAPDGGHYVVDVGCGQVRGPDDRLVELTDAARAAWVRDGIPVVLSTLIGPLG